MNDKNYYCSKCSKVFKEWDHPGCFILFDKCRGKTCPDCGRTRKLGKVRCRYEESTKPGKEGRTKYDCGRCGKMSVGFFTEHFENFFAKIGLN